jgi:NADH-ubiquinone oxidoreductase chain 2
MLVITAFILILCLSLPFIKNKLNSHLIRRICALSFLCASVLNFNTLIYIQKIGSGIGLFNGLFKLNFITIVISLILTLLSAILVIVWPKLKENSFKYADFNYYNDLKNSKIKIPSSAYALEDLKSSLFIKGVKNFQESISTLPNKIETTYIFSYNNVSKFNNSSANPSVEREYCLIVLFNILGALFLVSSNDLISIYLSIELQSFGLYILATLYKEKLSATSAGLKYFLLGGLSSCIILLGSGLIYTYTGLTNLESIYTLISIFSNSSYSMDVTYLVDNNQLQKLISLPGLPGWGINQFYMFFPVVDIDFKSYQSISSTANDLKGISIGFLLIFSGFLFKVAASPFHN